MSATSSSPAGWWSALEPAPVDVFFTRNDPDDPRLGDVVRRWTGGPVELKAGQPVLIGFPCDEGVRRNGGRVGTALAPQAIRNQLYRGTPWDRIDDVNIDTLGLIDLGDVRIDGPLEAMQERLGAVVGQLLRMRAVPIILGGGHETAFGHYLGYVHAGIECGILNVDAHLDVRPYEQGAHSGSPFRQAFEHPDMPLGPGRYVVQGAQCDKVARAHWQFVQAHGGKILLFDPSATATQEAVLFRKQLLYLEQEAGCENILVTVDADAFRQADVPGVSAPSPVGIAGAAWPEMARAAGLNHQVRSLEIVEVNPAFDRDAQTARWAALGVRQFLVGLAGRQTKG